jgi:hypothetical protein
MTRDPAAADVQGRHGVRPRKMMEPNGPDPISLVALVIRAIDDIEQTSNQDRDVLLDDLLHAAWGSVAAQNQ